MIVKKYLSVTILALALCFFIYDISNDIINKMDGYLHIFAELLVFIAVSIAFFHELQHVKQLHKAVTIEQSKNARLAGELFAVIQQQFNLWLLTPSEKEVALLLIKGFSMKEIAATRGVKEKTIRVQATSIYTKSGYTGRHELSAHFIEDLMSEV